MINLSFYQINIIQAFFVNVIHNRGLMLKTEKLYDYLKKSFNLLSFNNNYIIISSSTTLRQSFFSTVVIYFCHNFFNLNRTFILMGYCEVL